MDTIDDGLALEQDIPLSDEPIRRLVLRQLDRMNDDATFGEIIEQIVFVLGVVPPLARDPFVTKKEMVTALQHLPEDADFVDAIESLSTVRSLKVGLAEAERGEVTPHAEVIEWIKTWRK